MRVVVETFGDEPQAVGMPRGRLARSRRGLVRAAATGLAAGAVWGVAVRVFMRLVTTDKPAFSWVGTLSIIASTAVFGLVVGVAAQARREGRSRWWLLLAVPGLLLFAGPGMLFLPAFLLGGIALRVALAGGASPVRRTAALAAALVAVTVAPVLLWRSDRLNEVTMLSAPTRVQLAELLLMPVLGLWLAWHGRSLWWGVNNSPNGELLSGEGRQQLAKWGVVGTRRRISPRRFERAGGGAGTPAGRPPPVRHDPRPPTRRAHTPARRGCSPGGSRRSPARGRGSGR